MVDKKPIGYIPGKPYFLDKKPPKNPKFEKVGPTLDTGLTMKNVEIISDKSIAKRKGESFHRIKPLTLMKLLQQENNPESIYNLNENKEESKNEAPLHDNQSVISQQSNFTSITHVTDKLPIQDRSAFILLDLRDREEFDLFHIKEAINFGSPNISRDKFLPEMFIYKNKPGKIIIIYHSDERNGIPHASLLWQKGYENIYLLSGGMDEFLKDCPEMIEGKKIPEIPKKVPDLKKVILRSNFHETKTQSAEIINLGQKDFNNDEPKIPTINDKISKISHASLKSIKSELSRKPSSNNSKFGFGSSSKK